MPSETDVASKAIDWVWIGLKISGRGYAKKGKDTVALQSRSGPSCDFVRGKVYPLTTFLNCFLQYSAISVEYFSSLVFGFDKVKKIDPVNTKK